MPTFEAWFNALPSVDINSLDDEDKSCGICQLEYSFSSPTENLATDQQEDPASPLVTDLAEKPVRLHCGHFFGQICLHTWLRPGPEGANSNHCPTCRRQLFLRLRGGRFVLRAETPWLPPNPQGGAYPDGIDIEAARRSYEETLRRQGQEIEGFLQQIERWEQRTTEMNRVIERQMAQLDEVLARQEQDRERERRRDADAARQAYQEGWEEAARQRIQARMEHLEREMAEGLQLRGLREHQDNDEGWQQRNHARLERLLRRERRGY